MARTFLYTLPAAGLLFLLWSCLTPAKTSRRPAMPLHAHPGSCRQCHDVRSDFVLLAPLPGLCATAGCHPSLEQPFEKTHGPLALGDCATCHLQHSSAHPRLLVEAEGRLCADCHGKLLTCPSIEGPAAAGSAAPCTSCHGAHGGSSPHLLRTPVAVGFNRDE